MSSRGLFLVVTALLVGLGVLMVYSASMQARPTRQEEAMLARHSVCLAVGVVAAGIAACTRAAVWRRAAPLLFAICVVLLAAVLVPGIGAEVHGARRWLRFGPVGLQPAELAKPVLVLFLSCLAVGRLEGLRVQAARDRLDPWAPAPGRGTLRFAPAARPVRLLRVLAPTVLVAVLVMLEPDFGTAVFLGLVGFAMLFAAGVRLVKLVLLAAAVVPALALFVWLEPYRMERILGFLDTWSGDGEAPYHVRQLLLTLSSGGLFGRGLGCGWLKLSFLPEANTDSVFAVIGEELGLVGALTVIALWIVLLLAGLRMVRRTSDSFAALAALGLLAQLVLQAAINMAVAMALVPPKGIGLPLVSYGGSSLVASLFSVGLIVGLTRE